MLHLFATLHPMPSIVIPAVYSWARTLELMEVVQIGGVLGNVIIKTSLAWLPLGR